MKIAIAATSPGTDGQVSSHGARAEYYVIYDTQSGAVVAESNPCADLERGAGPRAAAYLAGKGVDKVAAADFGTRFNRELQASGIECLERSGAVSDVIREWAE